MQNLRENFNCKQCGERKDTMKRCTRCRNVYYCCRQCQMDDWPRHKTQCVTYKSPKSQTAANRTEQSANQPFLHRLYTTDDGSIYQNQSEGDTIAVENAIGPSGSSTVIDFNKYQKKPNDEMKNKEPSGCQDCASYLSSNQRFDDTPVLDQNEDYTDITVKANKEKFVISIQWNWTGEMIFKVFSKELRIPLDKLKVIHKGKLINESMIQSCVKKKAVFQVYGEKAEDESGLTKRDIDIMMAQMNISRNEAVRALRKNDSVIDAILDIGGK